MKQIMDIQGHSQCTGEKFGKRSFVELKHMPYNVIQHTVTI